MLSTSGTFAANSRLPDTRAIGRVGRESVGRHDFAMTLVRVAGPREERAKAEIKANAVIPA